MDSVGHILLGECPPLTTFVFLSVARNFQLRVILKADRKRESFDGFMREVGVQRSSLIFRYIECPFKPKGLR